MTAPTPGGSLLLDTHVFLWIAEGDERVGAAARQRLAAAPHRYLSPISVLEMRIKQMLGKLAMPDDVAPVLATLGVTALPLDIDAADRIADFPELVRHDPFDRALLGQAQQHGLELLTADERLLALDRPFVVDVRV